MKAVIIGASAGVGRELARVLAARGHELALVARDLRDLEAIAADLRLRHDVSVHIFADDVAHPDCDNLRDFVQTNLRNIGALFMIAGMVDPLDHGQMDDDDLEAVACTNFLGPARVINCLLPFCGPDTHIVVASTIATIRPRGRNVVYGAAKAGLEHYCMALRHAYSLGLHSVCCYRLGYIRTSMTFGQELMLPAASPERVAAMMVDRLGLSGVCYFPRWWALIGTALQLLPWEVFRRLTY
jgi:short-subunit dehydrogenase